MLQLRFLLYMHFRSSTNDATDRFMRDTIRGCHCAERFLLLHHTMNDHRPVFSGNTVFLVFRPWSSVLDHRRVASLNYFLFYQKVLHLEIQCSRQGKEEIKNWRKRIRHPSVPVAYLCIFLVIIERMFFLFLISRQQHSSGMACSFLLCVLKLKGWLCPVDSSSASRGCTF